jgi:hypothetical protein
MASVDSTSWARFTALIGKITAHIGTRALDGELETDLNNTFPTTGTEARELVASCQSAIAEGWMCAREAGGIRWCCIYCPKGPSNSRKSSSLSD